MSLRNNKVNVYHVDLTTGQEGGGGLLMPADVDQERGLEFIFADNNLYGNPTSLDDDFSGKWLLEVPRDKVNAAWELIKQGVKAGKLFVNKVTPRNRFEKHMICVYVKDKTFIPYLIETYHYLVECGLVDPDSPLKFKTDLQTAGIEEGSYLYTSDQLPAALEEFYDGQSRAMADSIFFSFDSKQHCDKVIGAADPQMAHAQLIERSKALHVLGNFLMISRNYDRFINSAKPSMLPTLFILKMNRLLQSFDGSIDSAQQLITHTQKIIVATQNAELYSRQLNNYARRKDASPVLINKLQDLIMVYLFAATEANSNYSHDFAKALKAILDKAALSSDRTTEAGFYQAIRENLDHFAHHLLEQKLLDIDERKDFISDYILRICIIKLYREQRLETLNSKTSGTQLSNSKTYPIAMAISSVDTLKNLAAILAHYATFISKFQAAQKATATNDDNDPAVSDLSKMLGDVRQEISDKFDTYATELAKEDKHYDELTASAENDTHALSGCINRLHQLNDATNLTADFKYRMIGLICHLMRFLNMNRNSKSSLFLSTEMLVFTDLSQRLDKLNSGGLTEKDVLRFEAAFAAFSEDYFRVSNYLYYWWQKQELVSNHLHGLWQLDPNKTALYSARQDLHDYCFNEHGFTPASLNKFMQESMKLIELNNTKSITLTHQCNKVELEFSHPTFTKLFGNETAVTGFYHILTTGINKQLQDKVPLAAILASPEYKVLVSTNELLSAIRKKDASSPDEILSLIRAYEVQCGNIATNANSLREGVGAMTRACRRALLTMHPTLLDDELKALKELTIVDDESIDQLYRYTESLKKTAHHLSGAASDRFSDHLTQVTLNMRELAPLLHTIEKTLVECNPLIDQLQLVKFGKDKNFTSIIWPLIKEIFDLLDFSRGTTLTTLDLIDKEFALSTRQAERIANILSALLTALTHYTKIVPPISAVNELLAGIIESDIGTVGNDGNEKTLVDILTALSNKLAGLSSKSTVRSDVEKFADAYNNLKIYDTLSNLANSPALKKIYDDVYQYNFATASFASFDKRSRDVFLYDASVYSSESDLDLVRVKHTLNILELEKSNKNLPPEFATRFNDLHTEVRADIEEQICKRTPPNQILTSPAYKIAENTVGLLKNLRTEPNLNADKVIQFFAAYEAQCIQPVSTAKRFLQVVANVIFAGLGALLFAGIGLGIGMLAGGGTPLSLIMGIAGMAKGGIMGAALGTMLACTITGGGMTTAKAANHLFFRAPAPERAAIALTQAVKNNQQLIVPPADSRRP